MLQILRLVRFYSSGSAIKTHENFLNKYLFYFIIAFLPSLILLKKHTRFRELLDFYKRMDESYCPARMVL